MKELLKIWPSAGQYTPSSTKRNARATKKGPGRYHKQGHSKANEAREAQLAQMAMFIGNAVANNMGAVANNMGAVV